LLDGWVSGDTRITHTKKVQVPPNAVSIPSRISLDRYPENPSMDYPDVSIPMPKSVDSILIYVVLYEKATELKEIRASIALGPTKVPST
jgi:hypothetical protein